MNDPAIFSSPKGPDNLLSEDSYPKKSTPKTNWTKISILTKRLLNPKE